MNEQQRFLDALPFWVNGRLSADEQAWMQAYLDAHPALASQLALQRAVQAQVREAGARLQQGHDPVRGWAEMQRRLRAEGASAAPAPAATPRAAPPSPWARLGQWWQAPSAQGWRLAQGLALGAVLAASAVLTLGPGAVPAPEPDAPPASSSTRGPAAAAGGPWGRVSFKAQTLETDLRLALVTTGLRIVAGPTTLGDYYVLAAPGVNLEAALDVLRRDKAVQAAERVDSLPADLPR